MWEKHHLGRAGTGQHRQEVTCSGGASTRHAVWLQNVSEKGEERVIMSLLAHSCKFCEVFFVSNAPVRISLVPGPWHRCHGTTFYWSSSEGSNLGGAPGGWDASQKRQRSFAGSRPEQ